jgi:hypothetical protein
MRWAKTLRQITTAPNGAIGAIRMNVRVAVRAVLQKGAFSFANSLTIQSLDLMETGVSRAPSSFYSLLSFQCRPPE